MQHHVSTDKHHLAETSVAKSVSRNAPGLQLKSHIS